MLFFQPKRKMIACDIRPRNACTVGNIQRIVDVYGYAHNALPRLYFRNRLRSSVIASLSSIAFSKSSCAEATFISAFSFSISSGISLIRRSSVALVFPVIMSDDFTSLMIVLGVIPCSALYFC